MEGGKNRGAVDKVVRGIVEGLLDGWYDGRWMDG